MRNKEELYKELEEKAISIRRNIVEMVYMASSGHPGGSLSIADILTVLYFLEMNVSPIEPKDENRDRFVLSKGHASPALYATLAERGFIKKEDLRKLVTQTTVEMYEELTPQLIQLIDQTKHDDTLTEAQKQDEISLHMLGYVKSCTNEIIIQVLSEILGLEDEDEE